MGNIDNMQQQIRFTHLIESRFERVYEVRRQFTDKTDGIGQQKRQIVNYYLAYGSIESCKELILGKHFTLCKKIHHGRLSDIGISHKSHTNHSATIFPLSRFLFVNFC